MVEEFIQSTFCELSFHQQCPVVLNTEHGVSMNCACACHVGGVREPRLDPGSPPALSQERELCGV